jgi:hypothetical protein
VELLGRSGSLPFTQDAQGLRVALGDGADARPFPVTLKISGPGPR